jgi:hypothetical protein
MVSGQSAYNYDLELEKMTLDPSISQYSFRAAGSPGATATADWVARTFRSLGLESQKESFEFTAWKITSPPKLFIDPDNNPATEADQIQLGSFIPKHMAYPTGRDGVFAQIVILPLPNQGEDFPTGFWNKFSTKGQIVLVGREFSSVPSWRENYISKMRAEPPSAIIHTWWFSENSWVPPYSASQEGRLYWFPGSELRYWDMKISVGMLNYVDGFKIRTLAEQGTVSASVVIDATVDKGSHYNVVARLAGLDANRIILFSSHYDSVMTAGFGDDGAGTAGLLELARIFATAKRTGAYNPPYTLMFTAFTAEELWLIGSSYFVKQHKSEMDDFLAVLNLDPIGSDRLLVSESPSNLHETVVEAARELGIPVTVIPREEASSDNWSFELPKERQDAIEYAWGVSVGLSDVEARPAVWLGSTPLSWSDSIYGKAGWAHTPYDNSTSTQAYGWMKPESIEAHLKVAALTSVKLATIAATATEQVSSTPSSATRQPLVDANIVYLIPLVALIFILPALYLIKNRSKKPVHS